MHPTAADLHQQQVTDADYLQLSRLVIEAAWRVDVGRADTLHEVFVDDGTLAISDGTLQGREQIRQWGQDAVDAHTFDGIRHLCGNMRFLVTGDQTAEGVTVLTPFFDNQPTTPGTSVPWTVGEDHDRFVRTEQGWRLLAQSWTWLFQRPEPARG
jgi:SnoaL-like domain